MPQKRPPYQPGNYYHFYNRGRSRLTIFHNHADYLAVLTKIKSYRAAFKLAIIAYCLMPNHYHFLVRQEGTFRAGLLPQRLFNSYAKTYNNRHQHSGTIFEDNYHVKLVDKPEYLLHVCRYIHANPVKDGVAQQVALWPYSNYLEWVGLRNGSLVDRSFVHTHFPNPADYQQFVQIYIENRQISPEFHGDIQQFP
jgi:REP element-mobilizing transposase RayT